MYVKKKTGQLKNTNEIPSTPKTIPNSSYVTVNNET
jgi:hypothetical protein